jgi:hypothetical protein
MMFQEPGAASLYLMESLDTRKLRPLPELPKRLEPSMGIEPMLSPLPRACFTTKLRRRSADARGTYSVEHLKPYH